jgi:hypothetical protein
VRRAWSNLKRCLRQETLAKQVWQDFLAQHDSVFVLAQHDTEHVGSVKSSLARTI